MSKFVKKASPILKRVAKMAAPNGSQEDNVGSRDRDVFKRCRVKSASLLTTGLPYSWHVCLHFGKPGEEVDGTAVRADLLGISVSQRHLCQHDVKLSLTHRANQHTAFIANQIRPLAAFYSRNSRCLPSPYGG